VAPVSRGGTGCPRSTAGKGQTTQCWQRSVRGARLPHGPWHKTVRHAHHGRQTEKKGVHKELPLRTLAMPFSWGPRTILVTAAGSE